MGGLARARRFFELLAASGVRNELVIEAFSPAGDEFFDLVERSTGAWSMELTLETPDEDLRRINGKFPCTNEAIESTIASALLHGCRKLDLFFMVGIPHQTKENAMATVDYCEHLVQRFGADPRLQFYVAPLGPFLDPGSRAFERPELGYHSRYRTLEEHRAALLEPSWQEILSYDTDEMSREGIVATSYAVAGGLNELKHRHGLIDDATYGLVVRHLSVAQHVLAEIEASRSLAPDSRRAVLERLRTDVAVANTESLCGKEELRWTPSVGLRVSWALLRGLSHALWLELIRSVARLRGRYDIDVPVGRQAAR
jgi:hypothetical protein